jgi:hypothetical protein
MKPLENEAKTQFEAFASLVGSVLSIPKAEILRREAEYQKTVGANPNRRGPKRKPKSSASHAPVSS